MKLYGLHEPDDRFGVREVSAMSEGVLHREAQRGLDDWCDLLDDLLNTGGMLPTRELAGRVVSFFEGGYWRAEEVRVEVLRREMVERNRQRRCVVSRTRGIR